MIRTRFVTYSLDVLWMKTNTVKKMQKVLGIRTSFKYFQIMYWNLWSLPFYYCKSILGSSGIKQISSQISVLINFELWKYIVILYDLELILIMCVDNGFAFVISVCHLYSYAPIWTIAALYHTQNYEFLPNDVKLHACCKSTLTSIHLGGFGRSISWAPRRVRWCESEKWWGNLPEIILGLLMYCEP